VIEIAPANGLEVFRNTADLTGEVQILQFLDMADTRTSHPEGGRKGIQAMGIRCGHPHPRNHHFLFHLSTKLILDELIQSNFLPPPQTTHPHPGPPLEGDGVLKLLRVAHP